MGQYIIKIKGCYMEWSTIVDAPVTNGMTLEEFVKYYMGKYGVRGMDALGERLDRVEKFGHSALGPSMTLTELLEHNHAGKNEECLTEDEIYKMYCTDVDESAKYVSADFSLVDYQSQSRKTWQLVRMDHPIVYPTMGLVNEAGELAGKVKKIFRDKAGVIGEEDRQALKQELGDVLWYLAQICTELDLTLEEVAEANITKLFSRLERGQIQGEGDNR